MSEFNTRLFPDIPIEDPSQDEFGRVDFANHIVDFLCLPADSPSLTVGIEGTWGMGKTSCLNLIVKKLWAHESKPLLVKFEPWLIGSLDSVIEGFLLQLATSMGHRSLGDEGKDVASKVLNFAKLLGPMKLIPGVEPWGTMVEKTLKAVGESTEAAADFSKLSLSDHKQDVEKAILKLKRPVVVIIDDFDRLPPDEIRIVIQLVKAVCDFKCVSYLLSYDSEPVHKAMSFNGQYDGRRYLEKIVQVSYHLPRIGYYQMKRYFIARLDKFISDHRIQLADFEETICNELLHQTALIRALKTPRDVIRLINRLKLTAVRTRNEVNFADVIVFDTLDLRYPRVIRTIKKDPSKFLNLAKFDEDLIYHDLKDRDQKTDELNPTEDKLITKMLKPYSQRDRKNIKNLLDFILPRPGIVGNRSEKESDQQLRITSPQALLKLMQAGLTDVTYSAVSVLAFFQASAGRDQFLDELVNRNELASWLSFATSFLDDNV